MHHQDATRAANMANVGERVEVVIPHFGQVWRGGEGPAIGKVKRVTVWRHLADELRCHAAGGARLGFDDDGLPQQRLEHTHERARGSIRRTASCVAQHHADGFIGIALGLGQWGPSRGKGQRNGGYRLDQCGSPNGFKDNKFARMNELSHRFWTRNSPSQ